ncbi:hypothetical protein KAK06_12070 [Ideonella sp. 4Y11]|uniref:Uncharacterized protein n=1 Tax=Ideonella aquatica TaxID=2824119 RepID=A0A941BLH2_9BURK|nr:hypothetical protein [Ideonella aquatica]MBQ0959684.1 hypothetical protein [Ideonella aquatica]
MNHTPITRHLPLCAALLAALATPLLQAAPKAQPMVLNGPTAVLSQSSPSGTAQVTVDGAGSFMEALVYTTADDDTYDMSYKSGMYFDGALYGVESVKQSQGNKAKSSYVVGSLQVDLKQALTLGAVAGSYQLKQVYTLTNPGTEPVSVNLMRYNDSDVGDYGYQPAGGRFSYVVSTATPSPESLTRYVGIQLTGGANTMRVVRYCCDNLNDITPEENNTVADDLDGDGVSEASWDKAINNQTTVVVPAGGSAKVHTVTLFGRSALGSLSALPAR